MDELLTDRLKSKLGLRPHLLAAGWHIPPDLSDIFKEVISQTDRSVKRDWIIAFYPNKEPLEDDISALVDTLSKKGQLWLCWPKKSSKQTSDLSDVVVRKIGLNSGLVDIKVTAINEVWSGLKFVFRKS